MKTVSVPVIKTDKDLQEALKSLERIFMADAGTQEADEREALALVIESYENKNFPIEAPDCITAIRFAMEQRGYSREKVAVVLGGASRLSEIFNGKRNLSLSQIRALHAELKIPLESLINAPSRVSPPNKLKSKQLVVREDRSGLFIDAKSPDRAPTQRNKRQAKPKTK